MPNEVTVTRQQRLRDLEARIVKDAETIQTNGLDIGRCLCEIRDDELWEDEYATWNEYLKERGAELVGKSFSQAAALIQAAEVKKRIPENISLIDQTNLTPTHLRELGRLAPKAGKDGERGAEKDYSELRTQDVVRVLKAAKKIAGDDPISVRDLHKAVDADLGVDRTEKAKETKAQRERDSRQDLHVFLDEMTGRIRAEVEMLSPLVDDKDVWKLVRKEHPHLMKCFIEACDSLADLVRRIGR